MNRALYQSTNPKDSELLLEWDEPMPGSWFVLICSVGASTTVAAFAGVAFLWPILTGVW